MTKCVCTDISCCSNNTSGLNIAQCSGCWLFSRLTSCQTSELVKQYLYMPAACITTAHMHKLLQDIQVLTFQLISNTVVCTWESLTYTSHWHNRSHSIPWRGSSDVVITYFAAMCVCVSCIQPACQRTSVFCERWQNSRMLVCDVYQKCNDTSNIMLNSSYFKDRSFHHWLIVVFGLMTRLSWIASTVLADMPGLLYHYMCRCSFSTLCHCVHSVTHLPVCLPTT